jgi:signal transduction histidine kinase
MKILVKRSLRRRIALGMAALAILIVSAHSVALYVIAEEHEEKKIDEVVTEEIEAFMERFRENRATPLPRTRSISSYVVRVSDDKSIKSLPPMLRNLSVGLHEVVEGKREWHIAVRAAGNERFYLVYDTTAHEEQLLELFWLLVFGVVIMTIAAGGLGYLAAGLLTQPVRDLASRVSRLDPGSSAPSLAARYSDEELQQLAQAFDEYSARMAQFVAREQEFIADVSHELRTPLTSIHTGCELLAGDARLPTDARSRVIRIARTAMRMTALIQSMLLLARAGQRATLEEFVLRECVEDAIEPLREDLMQREINWRNEIPPSQTINADRAALSVILANLLGNASDKTQAGHISVRLLNGALQVQDTGEGIASEDLPHVFDRHFRGRTAKAGSGSGLGLAIVKRIADQHGWSLSLQSSLGQGTVVTLRLS